MSIIRTLFLAILLSGCSVFSGIDEKYPSDWSVIKKEYDLCANLNGSFENIGDYTYSPNGASNYLAYRFGFEDLEEIVSSTFLELQCENNNSLLVKLMNTEKETQRKTIQLDNKGWHIEEGNLFFPVIDESLSDGFGGYIGKAHFRLSVAADGSLIGMQKSSRVGLALWLIPGGSSQTFWFRWKKFR